MLRLRRIQPPDRSLDPKTADCSSTGRTTANLGGAAPYWTSYSYTTSGQRKTETQHPATGNQTTTYNYGTANGPPPGQHNGHQERHLHYDLTGNTTHRPGATATQTLNWNSEGKLSSLIEGTKQTDYLYDADGNLLSAALPATVTPSFTSATPRSA